VRECEGRSKCVKGTEQQGDKAQQEVKENSDAIAILAAL
jgi:hypothetical protein